jgi:hypothetical protein
MYNLSNFTTAISYIYIYSALIGILWSFFTAFINWLIPLSLNLSSKDVLKRRIVFFSVLFSMLVSQFFYVLEQYMTIFINRIAEDADIIAPMIQNHFIGYLVLCLVMYMFSYWVIAELSLKLGKTLKHKLVFKSNMKIFGIF